MGVGARPPPACVWPRPVTCRGSEQHCPQTHTEPLYLNVLVAALCKEKCVLVMCFI